VSVDLVRRLLTLGLVQRDDMQHALLRHVATGTAVIQALIEDGGLAPRVLEEELARSDALLLRVVMPVIRLVDALPAGMCRALLAVPVRQDSFTGTVDVATVDPQSAHVEREFSYHLRSPIRRIRAPYAAIDEALKRIESGEFEVAPPPPPAPPIRLGRRTPVYISRSDIDTAALGVPQLARPASERPIPLVRRNANADNPPASLPADLAGLSRTITQRPPSHNLGPYSQGAPAGPFPDTGPLIDAIRQARSRDEIIDLLLNGLAMVAGRVGAFVARKGEYQGWRCNDAMADVERFRRLRIPADVPSVLATAVATGFYLGPIPQNGTHTELLEVMGGFASEIAVSPLRVEGKLALLLLLDGLGDSMIATRRAEELGRLAGEALGKLLQRDKQ
jgi:hypothetical protein